MKYMKIIGLLVMAVATMAGTGTASATSVTSNYQANPTTPFITASSTNSKIDGAWVTVECASSEIAFPVQSHGSGVAVAGNVSTLDFTSCNYQVTVVNPGTIEIQGVLGTGNGTVTSKGAVISLHTSVGTCVLKTTSGTDIGTLTGSNFTGSNAVLDLNSAKIPRDTGNFLCGPSGTWTGNYTVTSPSSLEVH